MQGRAVPWRAVAAFAVWAAALALAASGELLRSLRGNLFLAAALPSALAALAVLGWARWRGQTLPRARSWGALFLLALVSLSGVLLRRPYIDGVLRVHYAHAAEQGLILLAASLWLALLNGLRLLSEPVPRRTVAWTILAVGASCLLLPADDLTVRWNEVPALLLAVVWTATTVWSWSYARSTLAGSPVAITAGCGLAAIALVGGVAGALLPPPQGAFAGVPAATMGRLVGALLPAAVGAGISGVLWFWLLQHIDLSAFSLQFLVQWLAAGAVQFLLFGFLSWRLDLALLVGVGAVLVALTARPEDEEPLALKVT